MPPKTTNNNKNQKKGERVRRQGRQERGNGAAVSDLSLPGPAQNVLVDMYDIYSLGAKLFNGDGVEQNSEKAALLFLTAANSGVREAQAQLGLCYQFGRGVAKDFAESARWLALAADEPQGLPEAQYQLAEMYLAGIGVKKDLKEVVRLYNAAADGGHSAAQFTLGVAYREGSCYVEKDFVEAVRCLKQSAVNGHAGGQYELGVLFLEGKLVPRDYQEGRRLLELCAAHSETSAMAWMTLGQIYTKGWGVKKDAKRAKQYLLKAQKVDNSEAAGSQWFHSVPDIPEPVADHARMQLDRLQHTCTKCNSVSQEGTLNVCARCKGTRYCSSACQKADWPEHKHGCKERAKTP